MPADVTTPETLTPITSAWGASVAADLAELWSAVATSPAGGSTILDGIATPAPGDGATGDYYADLDDGILYGPKSATGYGAEQRPTIASNPNATNTQREAGVRYRFLRAGRVIGCRYQRYSGADTTQTIKAWKDSSSTKIAEIADPQAAVTGTFTVTFPTPVVVAADETWTFSAAATTNTSRLGTIQTVTDTADVRFVEYRQAGTLNVYPSTIGASTHYVEPIFQPNESWPVTVRTVAGNAPTRRTLNAQTGTTYTPVVADENRMVTLSNAATITVTLPSNSTATFPSGAEVDFLWYGVGQPTFAAGSGATIISKNAWLKMSVRYGVVTAKKTNTNEWLLYGDLAA